MALRILEFVLGFLLTGATLRAVFYTVVVPGSTRPAENLAPPRPKV